LHFPSSRLAFRRSPRVSIKIEGNSYEFLLDTGAELSVIPSSLLSSLPLDCSGHTPHTHSVQGFAGKDVVIKGPYSLPVEVCGVKFIHPIYIMDTLTPFVADYDLVCAAKLVIDPVRHMVWSYWHADLYATKSTRTLHTTKAHTFRVSDFHQYHCCEVKLFPVGCAQDSRRVP